MNSKSGQIIESIDTLLKRLSLSRNTAPFELLDAPDFPFAVSEEYVQMMKPREWFDPLLLQVLPREDELCRVDGFLDDAVGDLSAMVSPGLIHKYRNRALYLINQSCFGNCRFCFRRNIYSKQVFGSSLMSDSVLDYLKKNSSVDELIISGGEPLLLSDEQLAAFFKKVKEISHIKTLRIHSRLPVTHPSRFTPQFYEVLSELIHEKQCVLVLHVNHPQEIGEGCRRVIAQMRKRGVLLFSQTVLMNMINDSVEVLASLFSSLVLIGVVPYYLHQLDRANGTAHFQVDEKAGKEIVKGLRERLSGYAVPRYVRDVEGQRCKCVIM